MEDDFDKALKSLGNMYNDELRAREQLEEIEGFLNTCKNEIRSYKLPVITDNYYVELGEANEAIIERWYDNIIEKLNNIWVDIKQVGND